MMIPPPVRLGYPPAPKLSLGYVCLVRGVGWVMAQWSPALGFYDEDVLYPGSNGLVDMRQFNPYDILCWMPQDGN